MSEEELDIKFIPIYTGKINPNRLYKQLQQENSQLKQRIEKAIEYIEDTCYYPELENYSNMTDNEVKELLKILKGDDTNE